MIFSQLVSYFGRAGRQDVDGNLTGLLFFIVHLACQLLEEEAHNLCVEDVSCADLQLRKFSDAWTSYLPTKDAHDTYLGIVNLSSDVVSLRTVCLQRLGSSAPPVLLIANPVDLLRHGPVMLWKPLQTRNALFVPVNNFCAWIQPLSSTHNR